MSDLTPKERMAIARQEMPRQNPADRRANFDEVALGYSEETAILEAERCLQCKNAPCVKGCPVEIDIPKFILKLRERDFEEALAVIREKNSLPAICGRVCPQEDQCEMVCTLTKKFRPVAIGRLERFVADYEMKQGKMNIPPRAKPTGRSVAVIGAGPAGLTAAGILARLGYRVTIFEALHRPGGVLIYGIPEFRLPKDVVQREVDYVTGLGAELRSDMIVGRTVTIPELLNGDYQAVFVGTGAGHPIFMEIPGENLNGVYSANEYLTRINLMRAYLFPDWDTPVKRARRVAVVGGGNVAMDSARCALRMGADEVVIVYRRSRKELPAREEEIENAEAEGVKFQLLTTPVRIIGSDQGEVTGMECLKMELGEPDASGRARPIPVPGSEFVIPVDQVVMAIGTAANPIVAATTPGLEVNQRGYMVIDPHTGRTSLPGVWAGGDIVTGSATVISAMGAGMEAANDIHAYLTGSQKGSWRPET